MLNSITTYLFGSNDSCQTFNSVQLTTVIVEDEWLLVEKTELEQTPLAWNTDVSEPESLSSNDGSSDDSVSLPESPLEGSWLYTPNSPYNYNTTPNYKEDPEELHQPLENLLIEHPSMSVYTRAVPRFAVQVSTVESRLPRSKSPQTSASRSLGTIPTPAHYTWEASAMQKSPMRNFRKKWAKEPSKKVFARQNAIFTRRSGKSAMKRVFQPSKLQ